MKFMPHIVHEPFRHFYEDGVHAVTLDPPPGPEWAGWEVVYRDDVQAGKRTTRRVDRLSPGHQWLFGVLQEPSTAAAYGAAFGIPDLEPDPTLHGGGLHIMPPGSRLNGHVDYSLHPHLPGKERRLSVIVFLNDRWEEAWGGALCLLDPMGNVVKRIHPAPGRVVAFENSDLSYHAVEPVTGPAERVTAAVYFLTVARPGAVRRRAMFFPSKAE